MHVMIDRGGTTEMHPDVARHIPAIQALCREFGVQRLEIFGSAVTADFDPERSDVDFIVTYPEGYRFGYFGSRLFELEERLTDTLNRPAHLVMTSALRNTYFNAEASRTRTEIFDAAKIPDVA
jgi:predicted nucleotidyltransferase